MTIPVYVISMVGHERRVHIKKMFAEQGVKFEFFDAINGRKLSPTEKANVYDVDKARTLGYPLTDAEIGCALSHCGIYKKMMGENIPEAVIFEDDVLIDGNIQLFLQTYKQVVPADADIVLLGCVLQKFLRIQKALFPIMLKNTPYMVGGKRAKIGKSYGLNGGTHAYYITRAGAEKMMVHQMPKVCWASDELTGDMVHANHTLYAILPPIAKVQDIASTIGIDYVGETVLSMKPRYNKLVRLFMIKCGGFKRCMLQAKKRTKPL